MWEQLERGGYTAVLNYLERHSPFTCPIYGNANSAGFDYKPFTMRSGIYYIYEEMGEILGVAVGYNDGNVMIHSVSQMADSTVYSLIKDLPYHSVWGLNGKLPSVGDISSAAGKLFDSRSLDVMVLDEIGDNNEIVQECDFIRIDRRFMGSAYVSFIKKCLWDCFGFKSSSIDIRKRMKERTELEPYWILSKDGVYVSQAHVQAMTKSHAYIGGICTPREYRRRGYAKEVVKRACEFVFSVERLPSLSVSSSNTAAINLYEKLGFKKAGEMLVYMQERDFKGDENQNK